MPHRWLSDASLQEARDDLRRAARDTEILSHAPHAGDAFALLSDLRERIFGSRGRTAPPKPSLALVVDQEGWPGPRSAGGSCWYVTFERPDGRRVKLDVGSDRWGQMCVGEIGWLDVHHGKLRSFQVVVGVRQS